ncbi:hypothetical protein MC885_014535 [Smutsia gigantea]|nr:hypothetical protein MC885_014535 [Smutsia gigantea]
MAGASPATGAEGHGPGLAMPVCEPPESRNPSCHWSLSIDECQRRALLGGRETLHATRPSAHCRDTVQIVAQLVSEDVDKDVLLPHPPQSVGSTAFHTFLVRSSPFGKM